MAIVYDDTSIVLGALATKDTVVAASKIDASRENGFRVMKTEYAVAFENKTGGEGPIVFGLAAHHSATEIEECFEADPQDATELGNYQGKRPVWPLGIIHTSETVGKLYDGRFESVNPRWSIPEGQTLQWWAYNLDTGALTTGCVINVFAKHFGVWLRD